MSRSVLVVDDDDAFRGLVSRILRAWGHVVIGEAGSVAEALIQAESLRPDTVLVDVGLSDGDGFDLTRQLRGKPWPMRIVLFSADADCTNADGADRVGAIGFVPKDQMAGLVMRRLVGDRVTECGDHGGV